jgi:hypothetical protein
MKLRTRKYVIKRLVERSPHSKDYYKTKSNEDLEMYTEVYLKERIIILCKEPSVNNKKT